MRKKVLGLLILVVSLIVVAAACVGATGPAGPSGVGILVGCEEGTQPRAYLGESYFVAEITEEQVILTYTHRGPPCLNGREVILKEGDQIVVVGTFVPFVPAVK